MLFSSLSFSSLRMLFISSFFTLHNFHFILQIPFLLLSFQNRTSSPTSILAHLVQQCILSSIVYLLLGSFFSQRLIIMRRLWRQADLITSLRWSDCRCWVAELPRIQICIAAIILFGRTTTATLFLLTSSRCAQPQTKVIKLLTVYLRTHCAHFTQAQCRIQRCLKQLSIVG